MSLTNVLIGLAVVVYAVYRQLRTQRLDEGRGLRMPLVLGAVGVLQIYRFHQHHPVSAAGWALLTVSMALAVVFGVIRGATVKVWRGPDGTYRRGTVTTLVLWLVGLGMHLAVELMVRLVDPTVAGMAGASMMLYVGLTLACQQLCVQARAGWTPGRSLGAVSAYAASPRPGRPSRGTARGSVAGRRPTRTGGRARSRRAPHRLR